MHVALFHEDDFATLRPVAFRSFVQSRLSRSEVNGANQDTVSQRLYGDECGGVPKYRVGDRARISKAKRN